MKTELHVLGIRPCGPLHLCTGAAIVMTAALMLTGCGSTMLLDEDVMRKVSAPADTEPHVVRYTADFTAMPDSTIQERRYAVIRVGRDAAGFPREITVDDDANDRVLNIEGRILHADGSSTRIRPAAFYRVNVSDDKTIAEEYARVALMKDKLAQGDLVETVTLIEHTVPQMGIRFSPAMSGHAADNVSCSITTIPGHDLAVQLVNTTITPVITKTPEGTTSTFTWPPYKPPGRSYHAMLERNPSPALFIFPAGQSWTSFGDWYLDLTKDKLLPGTALADTTATVIAGKTSPREKMDAIFEYCQRNVRYEQMYVEHGEFIPNAAGVVLSRKFGDCKDYATLMHAMATSAGISAHLVIARRGRGYRMHDTLPVSQFNHVLLHYDDNGRDRWYDATDRLGLSGTPSFDLANARVLVVERGRSRLMTIAESSDNLLRIEGRLAATPESGLAGLLMVTFAQQYAVEFSWENEHRNPEKMRGLLTNTLREVLNPDLIIDSLGWTPGRDAFVVTARCRIPNCVATIGENRYIAPVRLFPNLLPDDAEEEGVQKAFYFPYYNRVAMDVAIVPAPGDRVPVYVRQDYQLPAGPFTDAERPAFLSKLAAAMSGFTRSIALTGHTQP